MDRNQSLIRFSVYALSPPNARDCFSPVAAALFQAGTTIAYEPCRRHQFFRNQIPHRDRAAVRITRNVSRYIWIFGLNKLHQFRRVNAGNAVVRVVFHPCHVSQSLNNHAVLAARKSEIVALAVFRFKRTQPFNRHFHLFAKFAHSSTSNAFSASSRASSNSFHHALASFITDVIQYI